MNALRRNVGIVTQKLILHVSAPDQVVIEGSDDTPLASQVIPTKYESGCRDSKVLSRYDSRRRIKRELLGAEESCWTDSAECAPVRLRLRAAAYRVKHWMFQQVHSARGGGRAA